MQDLTKITTPFALLKATDPETAAAMMAYKGSLEYWTEGNDWWASSGGPLHDSLTYRAKSVPVRVDVVMNGNVTGDFLIGPRRACDTHRLTLPTIDGKLIVGEYCNDAGDVMKVEVL